MRKSIASIALIRREEEGRTLWLAQWNEGWRSFSFVGGHKRDDESFRECVIREIDEELVLRDEQDILVASAPLAHLEYTDVSRRTGEQTEYVIELFDVTLIGSRARGKVDGNSANLWLSEPEIMAEQCADGRPVSPTPRRFLNHLGWDLFVSYAHQDDEPDGWVSALVQAIRAEHAEFTPTPLRVFFDRHEIRTMDDWQRRIYDGLHASTLMLAVLSENYFRREYCRKEWQVYRDHEVRRQMLGESIAPIYIVTVPGFEGPSDSRDDWVVDLRHRTDLTRRQYLDVRQWRPDGIEALRRNEVRQRLRCLDQQIAERLARARRIAESKNTVPRASDRFVGRTAELARLRETLPQGKVAAITAVQGIGGIGKTALAFLYAQAFADHYPGGRFLIDAARIDDLRIVLTRLAPDLGLELSESESKDLDLGAARVRGEIERRGRSLLILDNTEQPALLRTSERMRVLPAGDRLHVLVTTRMDGGDLDPAGIDLLPLDPLPEMDGVELFNRHRAIEGDDQWKAALRIARLLGGHTLALEVVAVYLWKHPEVSYAGYLARLEAEGSFAALSGTGQDRAVQLSAHPTTLIGPLLEPTLARLSPLELRALEYAALLPPDAVALPWVRELLSEDFPDSLVQRPGYPDPWQDLERRLLGLRLWMPGDDPRIVRMHRIVQVVVRARMDPGALQQQGERVQRWTLERAKALAEAQKLIEVAWEVEPLRDVALSGMSENRRESVHIALWITHSLLDLGFLGDASITVRAAVSCSERLVVSDPANATAQRDLSISYERLGYIATVQGDLSLAKRYFEQCRDIRLGLAEDESNSSAQRGLSVSYERLGDVLLTQGDLSGAKRYFELCRDIRLRLAEDEANAAAQRDLSVSYERLSDVALAQGDLGVAKRYVEQSRDICLQLMEHEADHLLQRSLSASYERLGNLALTQGDLADAKRNFERSHEIRLRLAVDKVNVAAQQDLAVSYDRLGNAALAEGDVTGAKGYYEQSLEIRLRLASDSANATAQRDLATSYERLGDVALAQGDLVVAKRNIEHSREIRERLASDPANASAQRDLSASYDRLGDFAVAEGDLAMAKFCFEESHRIRLRLASDPANATAQRDLSVSCDRRGVVARAEGDLVVANYYFAQSHHILSCLVVNEGNATAHRDLSTSFIRLGDVAAAQGDWVAARHYFEQSRKIRERLAMSDPGNAQRQRDLWVSYAKIARALERQSEDDARRWWQQAYDVMEGMQQRGMFLSPQDQQALAHIRGKLGI